MSATSRRVRSAAVLASGRVDLPERVRAALADVDLVVAADGGMALAEALALVPDLWVGDFDSAGEALRRAYPDVPRHEHPSDKDELDLELAVAVALDRGVRELVLVGVLDGRLDQTLAALLIAARLRAELGVAVRLLGAEHEAYLLAAGDALALELPTGTVFSLQSLVGDATVDVGGASFPLTRERLPFGVGLGVSNRAAGGPTVTVHDGVVALIVEWGEAPT